MKVSSSWCFSANPLEPRGYYAAQHIHNFSNIFAALSRVHVDFLTNVNVEIQGTSN